jgi:hypothetical protein
MTQLGPAATWSLACLPPVRVSLVRLVAEEPASLPPLPTTSLHGALEPALEALCDPLCPAHQELLEGAAPEAVRAAAGSAVAARGVTTAAPRPWTVAPVNTVDDVESVELAAGDVLSLRITVVGERALGCEGLLLGALGRAATAGVGIRPGHRGRPRFRLDAATPLPAPSLDGPLARRALLDCTTPLRLKRHDDSAPGTERRARFAEELDALTLWRALVRRAQTLAIAYGGGPIVDRAPPPPFTVAREVSHTVPIRRWSSHHRTRMEWPGLVGLWRLTADDAAPTPDLEACWRLLRFAEAVQIGSATGFGFGNVVVTAVG